jgi:hypothetical protein
MPRGGRRAGAGRKKGTKNAHTAVVAPKIKQTNVVPWDGCSRERVNQISRQRRGVRLSLTAQQLDRYSRPGQCDICGDDVQQLALDHCHVNGEFRGFLCTACNTGLGCFKDDRNRLRGAIGYLLDFVDRVRITKAAI